MSERALFGWMGFTIEHPADWAPVVISGTRRDGYARLQSSGSLAMQIRWSPGSESVSVASRSPKSASTMAGLQSKVVTYLDRLARDARKAKSTFEKTVSPREQGIDYRWKGRAHGAGRLFLDAALGKIFFVEVISSTGGSGTSALSSALKSFQTSCDSDTWALLGLNVRTPSGLEVERKLLQAGRTKLMLRGKGCRVELDRWGFAEQLVRKLDLDTWARAVLRMPRARARADSCGLELSQNSPLGQVNALVRINPELNQITLVRSASRSEKWRPQWDWLVS